MTSMTCWDVISKHICLISVQNCGGGGAGGAGSGEISRGGGDEEGIHVMFGDGIY